MVVVVYSTVMMVVTSVAGAVSVDTSVDVTVVVSVSVSVSMALCAATNPARRVMRREKGCMVAVCFWFLGGDFCRTWWVGKCSLDGDAFKRG